MRILFLTVYGLSWPYSLLVLVPALALGFPLLFAAWAGWRLRGARPAGGLGRAYLLACYAGSAQLTPLRGERLLPFVRFVVLMQCLHGYLAFDIIFLGRNIPMSIGMGGLLLATWLAYRYIGPVVIRQLRTWHTAAAFDKYPAAQRRAWGLLGQAYFWGAFTFVFISIGLHGMLAKHLPL